MFEQKSPILLVVRLSNSRVSKIFFASVSTASEARLTAFGALDTRSA